VVLERSLRHPDDALQRPAPTSRPTPAPIKTSDGFIVGEHVVYPQHGVGKIIAIERQEIAGATVEMLVIHFKNDNMTLRVPTTKSSAVGLRRLADEI
jgi:CarD family transcriptional regulator